MSHELGEKKAVLIVGHGSRLRYFQRPMEKLVHDLRKNKQYKKVYCCYLEITPPSLGDAIKASVEDGAEEILILPYFLLMGNHVKFDIPNIVKQAQKKYQSRAKLKLCPYLGYDEKILEVVQERLKGAL